MTAYVSALDLFSVGIGPSSSHTVGPMRAARDFGAECVAAPAGATIARVTCRLFGALGATGLGHGTPDAVLAGLAGMSPETCDPAAVRGLWPGRGERELLLAGRLPLRVSGGDLTFEPFVRLPGHPNALTLAAHDADGAVVLERTYYSVGGGFILRDGEDDDRPLP